MSVLVTGAIIVGLLVIAQPGQAVTLTIEGLPAGLTLSRLQDRTFSVVLGAQSIEPQDIKEIQISVTPEASATGATKTLSPAIVKADGSVVVGSPAIVRPTVSCGFQQSGFGYGYGSGYGYGGQFGYGYGNGAGFGYGYGYGYAGLNVRCTFTLAVPLFELAQPEVGFTLEAKVIRNSGPDAARTTTFTVYNTPPVATLEPLASIGNVPFNVIFGLGGDDPDRPFPAGASQVTWDLDYGDGSTPLLNQPGSALVGGATRSHTYASRGPFTAKLTLIDGDGGVDTEEVVVGLAPGVRLLPAFTRGPAPVTVAFNLEVADLDDNVEAIYVDFDNGDVFEGDATDLDVNGEIAFTQTYSAPGVYVARASARDADGQLGVDQATVIVDPPETCIPAIRFTDLDGLGRDAYRPPLDSTPAASTLATYTYGHIGTACADAIDNAPVFRGGYSDLSRGSTSNNFVFRATYFDFDNDDPVNDAIDAFDDKAFIRVLVQSPPGNTVANFPLAPKAGQAQPYDYTQGVVYEATVAGASLGVGTYTLVFEANDGHATIATARASSTVTGPQVIANVYQGTAALVNPANRALLSALGPNPPAEVLPPLSVAGVDGIDSDTFQLDATATAGVGYSLLPVATTSDWDVCFYRPAGPSLTALAPLSCNTAASTGTIPAGASHANVWAHTSGGATALTPGSFLFSWGVTKTNTVPTFLAPTPSGAGQIDVWRDLVPFDDVLASPEGALASLTSVASVGALRTSTVLLPLPTEGEHRFVAHYDANAPAHAAIPTDEALDAIMVQRFANDPPVPDIAGSPRIVDRNEPVTFTLLGSDPDDSQGARAAALGGLATWKIVYGPGDEESGTLPIPATKVKSFSLSGTQNVAFTLTDRQGVQRTDFETITVGATFVPPPATTATTTSTTTTTTTTPAATTTPTTPTTPPIVTTPPTSATTSPSPTGTTATTPPTTTSGSPSPSSSAPVQVDLTGSVAIIADDSLHVSIDAEGHVQLRWSLPPNAPILDIDGFQVFRAASPFALIATIHDPNAREFTDTSAEEGKSYRYLVSFFTAAAGIKGDVAEIVGDAAASSADLGVPVRVSAASAGAPLTTGGSTDRSPLYIVLAAVAVLVIAAIVVLTMLGRSRDSSLVLLGAPPPPTVVAPARVPRVIETVSATGQSERFLILHCGACSQDFQTPYSDQRPLIRNCANCGRLGILPGLKEAAGPPGGVTLSELGGLDEDALARLAAWNVTTSEQMRRVHPVEVSTVTQIPVEALDRMRAKADLIRLKGVGPRAADALVTLGVVSAEHLAAQEPKELLALVADLKSEAGKPVLARLSRGIVNEWIQAAKSRRLDADIRRQEPYKFQPPLAPPTTPTPETAGEASA